MSDSGDRSKVCYNFIITNLVAKENFTEQQKLMHTFNNSVTSLADLKWMSRMSRMMVAFHR